MTVTLHWWFCPIFVTIAAFLWAAWVCRGDTGWFGGIMVVVMVPVALAISLLAWFIGALFK